MRILPLISALLLSGCCVNAPSGGSAGGTKSAEEPAVAVDLATLLKDYQDNEVRADGLYKGKRVEIAGKISDIGVSLGRPHLQIGLKGTPHEHPVLQCGFGKGESDKIATLAKGADVKVVGKVGGKILHVVASDCQLLP